MLGFTLDDSGREQVDLEDGRILSFSRYHDHHIHLIRDSSGRSCYTQYTQKFPPDPELIEVMGAARIAYRERWGYCAGCPDGERYSADTRARWKAEDERAAAEEASNPWLKPAGPAARGEQ